MGLGYPMNGIGGAIVGSNNLMTIQNITDRADSLWNRSPIPYNHKDYTGTEIQNMDMMFSNGYVRPTWDNQTQFEKDRAEAINVYNQLLKNGCTDINLACDLQNSRVSGEFTKESIPSTDYGGMLINEYNQKYYTPKGIKYQELTRVQKMGLLKCKVMISLGKKLIKFSN